MGAHEDAEAASAEEEDDVLQFHETDHAASAEDVPYDGVGLEECIEALTADDPEICARAADALLDVPAGGASSGQRGAPWAYAVVAAGAVIPLLAMVQRVRRDARDGLKPKPADVCPENTDAVVAGGDAALLVLAEVANAAASFLQEEGWEVAYDEDTERPIFVDEKSGMSQSAPPALERARGDWVVGVMIEALTLIQPLDVDARAGEPRWPVRVLRHVCLSSRAPDDKNARGVVDDDCLSVLDIAVEEGGGDERTRVLVRGPWRGSQGDVEGETDPNEAPGTALDSWRDATVFAALALGFATESVMKPPTRVLVLGLRCGAVPAFVRRAFPSVAVDVVEESAAAVAAAREFFRADFHEEPFGELTREGFRARLDRAPPVGSDGKYRVWSGVDAWTFLDAAARASDAGAGAAFFFDGIVGDLPPSLIRSNRSAFEFFQTIKTSSLLDADRAVVALAGGWTRDARRSFGAACAACAAAFGGDRTTAACEPDDVPKLDALAAEDADEASRRTKRAKTSAATNAEDAHEDAQHETEKEANVRRHRGRFERAEGRAGVVIAGVGAAASPPAWAAYADAARRLRVAGVAAGPSPFAVDEADPVRDSAGSAGPGGSDDTSPSAVWHVSFRASDEDTDEAGAGDPAARAAAAAAEARANAGNDAWDVFGDSRAGGAGSDAPARGGVGGGGVNDFTLGAGEGAPGDAPGAASPAPPAPLSDVGDARYWTETLGAAVCGGDFSVVSDVSGFSGESHRAEVTEKGYVWGDVVVPPELTSRLAVAIASAVKHGWPPAAVFLCDDAWRATAALWARAEAMLGCSAGEDEVVLEPSLAAFALDPAADKARRRYVGNNFGVPHRDYAVKDVRRGGGGSSRSEKNDENDDRETEATPEPPPEVLSVWLPVVDVTPNNGCMYVVPVAHDARDASTPPTFDRTGAIALAPAPAGSLMAWAGDTVHWGTACVANLPANEQPRASLAFVFRRREASCDARGAPLTKRECFGAPGGLSLKRRLEVVRHALTCFEHWYGDTRETRERLTPDA